MERETRLVHAGRDPEQHHGIVNFPLYRASTILYPTMADYERRHERRYTAFGYGIHGTPTTMALGDALAELSGGARTLLLSSGLSAVTQTLAAFLRRDDHLLVADTPKAFAESVTRLLEAPGLRSILARAAREQIARTHNWDTSMSILDDLLRPVHRTS